MSSAKNTAFGRCCFLKFHTIHPSDRDTRSVIHPQHPAFLMAFRSDSILARTTTVMTVSCSGDIVHREGFASTKTRFFPFLFSFFLF